MSSKDYKLDNPIWYSLSESHQHYAIPFENIKFYQPDYCAFGGFSSLENINSAISEYSTLSSNFFIVGQKPTIPDHLILKEELKCFQMICRSKIDYQYKDELIELKEEHRTDLLGLVAIVYPEYFKNKTATLGAYFGIYKNGKLVSITGERMRMNDYIEVTTVITHPRHLRNGYAKQLVAKTTDFILDQGKTPFLHVAQTNDIAINLYTDLGFEIRSEMSFWNLIKKD